MNAYERLKNRQQKEFNAFPIGAAFGKQQLVEMLKNWGLTVYDADKILSIGCGCFIRKTDQEAFDRMLTRHRKEMEKAIADDKRGDGFIYDMFLYELANHEFCITCDLTETINALGLTVDKINGDKRLLYGLKKAKNEYLKHYDTFF